MIREVRMLNAKKVVRNIIKNSGYYDLADNPENDLMEVLEIRWTSKYLRYEPIKFLEMIEVIAKDIALNTSDYKFDIISEYTGEFVTFSMQVELIASILLNDCVDIAVEVVF